MTVIIRLTLILLLPFFLQKKEIPIPNDNMQDPNSYCNARFEFCVDYPVAELPERLLSDNGDGIILESKEKDILVTVSGSWSVSNENTSELFTHFIRERLEFSPDSDIRYSIVEDNYYEVMFALNDHLYYQKLFNEGNKQVILQIEAPEYRYDKLIELKKEIKMIFL